MLTPATTRWIALLAIVLLLLSACGDDRAPEVAVPSWGHVAPEQIAEARKHGVPVAFENDLGMRFVLIPAGTFLMGAPEDEGEGFDYSARPRHEVTLTRPFYMQITEVTNGQYRQFEPGHERTDGGKDESSVQRDEAHRSWNGDHQPVGMVSWRDAEAFAAWLTEIGDGRQYGLPTEAQWEYACRAGTTTRFWSGDTEDDLARVAWYAVDPESLEGVSHPVGEKPANPWGLHDMHGNLWEHCLDWYGEYGAFRAVDPRGPWHAVWDRRRPTGRVARGGSVLSAWDLEGSSNRCSGDDTDQCIDCGFRLVSPLSEPVDRPAPHPRWDTVIEAVANSVTYGRLRISAQEGLVPLGPDPASGLYEFAVEGSGRVPLRSQATGELMLEDDFAIVLVLVPGGTFWMGAQKEAAESPNYEPSALDDESPVHEVTLSPFLLSKHEITNSQWTALTGRDPSGVEEAGRFPVEGLSWRECRKTLGEHGLCLPTEAQWEYACRAGAKTPYWAGDSEDALARVAWFWAGYGSEHHAVGELQANAFGLLDTHGNASEWCEDRYHGTYEGAPTDGRAWVEGGRDLRVSRGGTWNSPASDLRSAYRAWGNAGMSYPGQGLRAARLIAPP